MKPNQIRWTVEQVAAELGVTKDQATDLLSGVPSIRAEYFADDVIAAANPSLSSLRKEERELRTKFIELRNATFRCERIETAPLEHAVSCEVATTRWAITASAADSNYKNKLLGDIYALLEHLLEKKYAE